MLMPCVCVFVFVFVFVFADCSLQFAVFVFVFVFVLFLYIICIYVLVSFFFPHYGASADEKPRQEGPNKNNPPKGALRESENASVLTMRIYSSL
jgi:hypothetical protein